MKLLDKAKLKNKTLFSFSRLSKFWNSIWTNGLQSKWFHNESFWVKLILFFSNKRNGQLNGPLRSVGIFHVSGNFPQWASVATVTVVVLFRFGQLQSSRRRLVPASWHRNLGYGHFGRGRLKMVGVPEAVAFSFEVPRNLIGPLRSFMLHCAWRHRSHQTVICPHFMVSAANGQSRSSRSWTRSWTLRSIVFIYLSKIVYVLVSDEFRMKGFWGWHLYYSGFWRGRNRSFRSSLVVEKVHIGPVFSFVVALGSGQPYGPVAGLVAGRRPAHRSDGLLVAPQHARIITSQPGSFRAFWCCKLLYSIVIIVLVC